MPTSKRPSAASTVQIENDVVRVTEWRFAPGTSTGFHRHAHDYVVVPLTTARLRILTHNDQLYGELVAGAAYFRPAGVEHEVINENDFEVVFVETELKQTGSS